MSKMYPNLDDVNYENERRRSSIQSDTKCAQIFTKGTAITKDILEKFDECDLGTQKSSICGRTFKTRQLWVLAGLCLLFSTSCLGMGLMFGTTTFDSYLLSNLILRNNTPTYEVWKGPLITTLVKVYVFNYTNVEEYENGSADKLHVNEVGPYVYEETTEKINIQFRPNGTVSYQEKRLHRYRADLSNGRLQNESVLVPNFPLLGAAAFSRDFLYPLRAAMSGILKQLNAEPFVNVTVDQFIWGYEDTFYTVTRNLLSFYKKLPFENFGILAGRNGTSDDVISIHTGENDINKLQQIDTFNGRNVLPYWSTEKCNKVKGSDGAAFPPFQIRQQRQISIFNKDICRSVPLVYDKDVKVFNGKMAAYRYTLPKTAFDTPETNPENQCYCDTETDECSPQGVINTAPCAFGAPAFVSLPHFHLADPNIKSAISGLHETPLEYETYINLHPTLGFTMSGKNRFQLNVQVQKSYGMEQLDMFEDDLILPMAWFEMGLDEDDLPDSVKNTIYTVSVTAPAIEMFFKYGSLLAAIVTLTAALIVLRGKWIEKQQKIIRNSHLTHSFR